MIVLYHRDNDGLAAASVLYRVAAETNESFNAFDAQYGEPCPLFEPKRAAWTGAEVYIVDFSYPPEVLRRIATSATKVVVIDHHKSAIEQLRGVDMPSNVELILDDSKVGCLLTWERFFRFDPPEILLDIADRDMFIGDRPNANATSMFVRTLNVSPRGFVEFFAPAQYKEVVDRGEAMWAYHYWLCSQAKVVESSLDGIRCGFTECPGALVSDTARIWLEKNPDIDLFVAHSIESRTQAIVGLRSRKGSSVDVSEIAQKYGGGGHKNSAGYIITGTDLVLDS